MKTSPFYSIIFSLLAFAPLCISAQSPEFTLVQQGIAGDSSYYDICKVSEDEFWAIGKKGIITRLDAEGNTNMISYPNSGADLLNMTVMDANHYLLCGDKGTIYKFDRQQGSWSMEQVKGFENSCFYSICAIDENIAFISGGKSGIVRSKKVIPFGFILKTEDGGKTWKKVYRSASSMVWSIKYDKTNSRLLALTYNPFRSLIIFSGKEGISWKKQTRIARELFHDFNVGEAELFLAGGKNFNYKKNGMVRFGNNFTHYENTGLFWDVEANNRWALACGSNGDILLKTGSDSWKLLSAPVKKNLYEICVINEKSVYLVGTGKTILRMDVASNYTNTNPPQISRISTE